MSILVALINGLLVLGTLVQVVKGYGSVLGLIPVSLLFGTTAFFAIRGGRITWIVAVLANLLMLAGSLLVMVTANSEMRILSLIGIPSTLNLAFLVWRTPKKAQPQPEPEPEPETQAPA